MEAATIAQGTRAEAVIYHRLSDDLDVLEIYVGIVDEPHRYLCIENFITPRIRELERHRGKSISFEMLFKDYQNLHERFLAIRKTLL